MARLRNWLNHRIKEPLLGEIKRGATPEGLASAAAVGVVVSVVPVFGVTTGLCFLAGKIFRLNHVVLQTVNFFMYPAQLLLMIPFLRIGEIAARAESAVVFPNLLLEEFSASPRGFFVKFGNVVAHAALGWLLVAPFAILGLNFLLRWLFTRFSVRFSPHK